MNYQLGMLTPFGLILQVGWNSFAWRAESCQCGYFDEAYGLFLLLTGPEVWRHGWRQLFLVRVQATVTSPLEQFTY